MSASQDPGEIVVCSYNVHGGVGIDGRYDPHRSAAVIAETGADIIALQEVESRARPAGKLDQFDLYQRATGFHAVVGSNIITGNGRYGNVLLSRWPVRSHALHRLGIEHYEPRGAIEAEIELGASALRIVCTHLGLRHRERRKQIDRLVKVVRRTGSTPTLVMGDFNVWGWERAALAPIGYRRFPGSRVRSWPAALPLLPLDRIWSRPPGLCRKIKTLRSPLSRRASDHLPVIATVVLPDSL